MKRSCQKVQSFSKSIEKKWYNPLKKDERLAVNTNKIIGDEVKSRIKNKGKKKNKKLKLKKYKDIFLSLTIFGSLETKKHNRYGWMAMFWCLNRRRLICRRISNTPTQFLFFFCVIKFIFIKKSYFEKRLLFFCTGSPNLTRWTFFGAYQKMRFTTRNSSGSVRQNGSSELESSGEHLKTMENVLVLRGSSSIFFFLRPLQEGFGLILTNMKMVVSRSFRWVVSTTAIPQSDHLLSIDNIKRCLDKISVWN